MIFQFCCSINAEFRKWGVGKETGATLSTVSYTLLQMKEAGVALSSACCQVSLTANPAFGSFSHGHATHTRKPTKLSRVLSFLQSSVSCLLRRLIGCLRLGEIFGCLSLHLFPLLHSSPPCLLLPVLLTARVQCCSIDAECRKWCVTNNKASWTTFLLNQTQRRQEYELLLIRHIDKCNWTHGAYMTIL